MCEFCHKHGEGKTWYLEAANYAEDMLADVRRQEFVRHMATDGAGMAAQVERLALLKTLPAFVRRAVSWAISARMKRIHWGQVVPIEELAAIFEFVGSVVRLECVCRRGRLGEGHRCCYGVSIAPDGGRLLELFRDFGNSEPTNPDVRRMEVLSPAAALEQMRGYETEGLVHTIWTLHTPFIGGICNCDRTDCLAMRATLAYDTQLFFRAEFTARVDPDRCTGCRQCLRVCQFAALRYSAARGAVTVEPEQCYGCGVCRSVCAQDAIRLDKRRAAPLAEVRR